MVDDRIWSVKTKYFHSKYSRISMARISLGPWKFFQDIGSSSHGELIITPGQEAIGDNLGIFFFFFSDLLDSSGILSVLIRIA